MLRKQFKVKQDEKLTAAMFNTQAAVEHLPSWADKFIEKLESDIKKLKSENEKLKSDRENSAKAEKLQADLKRTESELAEKTQALKSAITRLDEYNAKIKKLETDKAVLTAQAEKLAQEVKRLQVLRKPVSSPVRYNPNPRPASGYSDW